MKNYFVSAEKKTPEIVFITDGELKITGSSRPEDARTFYKPLFEWIKEFKKTDPSKINLILDLDYINSASIRIVLDVLKALKEVLQDKSRFKVTWKYEKNDVDALDQGKILEKNLQHSFEFFEKPV